MGNRRLVVAILLTGLVGGVGGGEFARAQFDKPFLVADATKQGHIDFYVGGELGARMRVSELGEDGGTRLLSMVVLDERGKGLILDGTRWRCDRLSRRFVVTGRLGGKPMKATYGVRTPSCRDRLDVGLPRRSRPGGSVRMVVRDEWGIGDLRLRLCKVEAGDRSRCRDIRMLRNRARIVMRFRLHREGRARVLLTGAGIRVSRSVAVGIRALSGAGEGRRPRILAAGDSMMQGVDAFLADRLASRARIFRDVNPNSGISKPGLNWAQHARDYTRRVRPDASIVFLGANEGFAIRSASGQLVACCASAWYGEFASRVRSMMITYGAGKADVFWLSMPAPRSPERQALQNVVNAAVLKAAEGLPSVRVVRLDRVFTPGGVYRDVMTYRGRRVRVRESDGLHLSLPGARIAADKVTAALRAARIVR